MQTLLKSKSNSASSSESRAEIKAVSAPVIPLNNEEVNVKVQISAPSYLHSLKENDAPPFKKPEKEAKPHLLMSTIMNEDEAVETIAAASADGEGLKRYLGEFLVAKKVIQHYNSSEKSFLISLLSETIDYAAKRDFTAYKLACLITIYLDVHIHFKWFFWQSPENLWCYFKEIMIRHTIEDSPDGQEVFEPEEMLRYNEATSTLCT
ncbi:hypothetical protein evm_005020 [Chilo suppressalis]|nr:hypothetical protein evm_005020 [Chilo suppressalis]